MSHHKIEAKEITFDYPDGTRAVNNVNFMIHHGESVGILGANGAGKSTLLLLLMGVLFPSKGGVYVADVKLDQKSAKKIRPHLGFVFQNPDDQLFMNTIYDDVAFGPQNLLLDRDEVEKRTNHAIIHMGIEHIKTRPPYHCSGGEKRAAAIAGVLSMQPDIMIMDEPTSGLDPKARRSMIALLKSFSHTKIIASHDIDMVYEVCGRVLIIQNGEIKADGVAADIVSDKEKMDAYGLEPPLFMTRVQPLK